MNKNIFRRALSQIQGCGTSEHSNPEAKISEAENATEESLVAGYKSTLSPLSEGFAPPKKKASKKQPSNEARLDAVIQSENANVWQKLQFASEAKEKRDRAKFLKD